MCMSASRVVMVVRVSMCRIMCKLCLLLCCVCSDKLGLTPVIWVAYVVPLHDLAISRDSHVILAVLTPVYVDFVALDIPVSVSRVLSANELTSWGKVHLEGATIICPVPYSFNAHIYFYLILVKLRIVD
jgi:hypothetical protein